MKKNLIIALMATTLLLAGCSGNETNSEVKDEPAKVETQENKDEASEVESEEPASETEATDDIKYADMIPDPYEVFSNGEVSIIDEDGGKQYLFQVTNYTVEEVNAYIDGCKEMGFNEIKYDDTNDGGKMFGAYTEDGKYWVEVLMGNDSKIVAVTCKTSRKHKG